MIESFFLNIFDILKKILVICSSIPILIIGMKTTHHINRADAKVLRSLVGQYVRVAIVPDGYSRNNFDVQIAVGGKLECKQEGNSEPHYRVLSDDDNFTYFMVKDVILVNTLATRPTIMLNIPVEVA